MAMMTMKRVNQSNSQRHDIDNYVNQWDRKEHSKTNEATNEDRIGEMQESTGLAAIIGAGTKSVMELMRNRNMERIANRIRSGIGTWNGSGAETNTTCRSGGLSVRAGPTAWNQNGSQRAEDVELAGAAASDRSASNSGPAAWSAARAGRNLRESL